MAVQGRGFCWLCWGLTSLRGGEAERVCDTFSIMVSIEQGVQVILCDLFNIILVMRKRLYAVIFILSIFAWVRNASHIISRTVSSLYWMSDLRKLQLILLTSYIPVPGILLDVYKITRLRPLTHSYRKPKCKRGFGLRLHTDIVVHTKCGHTIKSIYIYFHVQSGINL